MTRYSVDPEVGLEGRGIDTKSATPRSVLGSALAFFPGVRSRIAVYGPLQALSPLLAPEGSPLDQFYP